VALLKSGIPSRQRNEEVRQREQTRADGHCHVIGTSKRNRIATSSMLSSKKPINQIRKQLPSNSPMGRTGVTKSCSSVPRSFSRTMENAVRKVVTFNSRTATKTGQKEIGRTRIGIKQNFGRISTGKAASLLARTRRNDSSSPMAVVTLIAWPATDESEPSSAPGLARRSGAATVGVIHGNLDAHAALAGMIASFRSGRC